MRKEFKDPSPNQWNKDFKDAHETELLFKVSNLISLLQRNWKKCRISVWVSSVWLWLRPSIMSYKVFFPTHKCSGHLLFCLLNVCSGLLLAIESLSCRKAAARGLGGAVTVPVQDGQVDQPWLIQSIPNSSHVLSGYLISSALGFSNGALGVLT